MNKRIVGSWEMSICIVTMLVAVTSVWAEDETQYIDPKAKSVSNEGNKAGKIDHGTGATGDASATAAQSIIPLGNSIVITSKVFKPPTGKQFNPMPVKLDGKKTYVDVWKLSAGSNVVRIKDSSSEVQIRCMFPADTAGDFPMACEGNLADAGTMEGFAGGEGEHWSAKVENKKFDLIIFNGQNGPEVSEEKEETVGAFSVANLNDTDGDGRVDKDETGADAANRIVGEKDMIKVIIKKVTDEAITGNVDLTITGDVGRVKLWNKQTKEDGEMTARSFAMGDLPKTFWVEGTDVSTKVRGLTLEIKKGNDSLDKAKLTFMWATRTGADFGRTTAINLLKADAWKNMTPAPKDFFKGDTPWLDGTGLIPLATGNRIMNSMVIKYKIEPANVWKEPGVKFDLTRQAIGKVWHKTAEGWQPPTVKTDPGDDETANDDADGDTDESDAPNNAGEMFQADAPGIPYGVSPTGGMTNYVMRVNFREFIRVSFDGQRPSGARKVGSRCGDRYEWHCRHQWSDNNGWVRDGGANINDIGPNHITVGDNP